MKVSLCSKRVRHRAVVGIASAVRCLAGCTTVGPDYVPPRRIGGFWYALATRDPLQKLQSYVYDYVSYSGDAPARAMSSRMDRATPDAVRASLDDLETAGCDEVFLVPATAELAEVERAAEIVAKR